MDWPLENFRPSGSDLDSVFRYVPQRTRVIRLLSKDKSPVIWSLDSHSDWERWLKQEVPSVDGSDSGLVLILARRASENTSGRGRRGVRQLPFKKETFIEISRKFFIHGSISRVINRADVPVFSWAEVPMAGYESEKNYPVSVYNCRSTNIWENDLALTVTYFPRKRLAFGILFGCTESIEREVMNRLSKNREHVCHPLLLPGIFAELERARMTEVVESTIDKVEGLIFDIDAGNVAKELESGNTGGLRSDRRTTWLNTAFLRSRLQTWRTQLSKMREYNDYLVVEAKFGTCSDQNPLRRTSFLIKERLNILIEEFGEMIEDCTRQIDGMAMATQWAQGDTNVDIATATRQDSSQMLSISLVTMLFLPGTFFATIFSMTFFNWDPDSGPIISSYVWIYIAIAGASTILTIFLWWYFLVSRRKVCPSPKDGSCSSKGSGDSMA